ncbi:tetratricopeptide repeat protein [Wohlfahrtiimonas chitiniclastica]|uniref:tetratricopeptide repeat protein n=1 Tax=Wohlfahrtiimonas chitiniclastica TaxID=400946 RepID=UPI0007B69B10|nr:tetratricopeptide repeat protein [Wohlfahrtiimonas chitiniclastica]KZX37789.1 hypothetical protein A6V30_02620 [Wohlfahrtiimonas chitiniclastica]
MIKQMTLGLVVGLFISMGSASANEPKQDNLMLNFLLGELAFQRNDLETAENYLAKVTEDNNIAYVLRQQFNIAYINGDYLKALSLLNQILEDEPDNIEVLLFEAIIYAHLNDNGKAAAVMNRVAMLYTQDQPDDNGFHFLYRELKGAIAPAQFLTIYRQIAKMNDYSPDVTPLLASLLVDNGLYDEALMYLTGVIESDPNSAVNYALLMYVYALLNEPQKGLAIVKAAAEKSDNVDLKLEYAQGLINQFDYSGALQYTKGLEARYPNNARVQGQLAFLYFAYQDSEAARNHLDKMVQLKGDYVDVIYKMADFARSAGRIGDLYDVLPNVNVIDVQVVRLLSEADMALKKKSYATFLAIFDELRTKFPDRAEYLYNQQLEMLEASFDYQLLLPYAEILDVVTNYEVFTYSYYKAIAYEGMQKPAQMQAVLKAWLNKYPDDPLALNGYGYMLLENAKTAAQEKKAMGYLQKAIALAPDEPAIMDSLGWAYFKAKDYVKARQYIVPAFHRLKEPDVISHYIALLIEEQSIDQARALFEQLQTLLPTHPETLALLKQYPEVLQ